jgi:AbrB family looped-hinge helix DNA binding protein
MPDSTLTSKGQVTVPKEIREELGVKPGDRVTFTAMPDGTVIMRAKTRSIKDLAGILHKEGRETVPLDKLSM